MEISSQIDSFFSRHKMHHSQIDFMKELERYRSEMLRGLKGEKASLAMLPTYIPLITKLPENRPVIVIDAGGTNLRVGVVTLKAGEDPIIEHFSKYSMPGSVSRITKDEFYDTITEYLLPLLDYSSTISFCFSFPCEVLPNQDGKVLYLSKEIYIDGIENTVLGKEINERLSAKGLSTKKFVVINDTVAAMLGAVGHRTTKNTLGNIGFVLGTGTNTCYGEDSAKITKLPSSTGWSGPMIINVESGNYSLFSQGAGDLLLDNSSKNPGRYVFEKMISGAYQGRLIYLTAQLAAKEGLFSPQFASNLEGMESFHLKDVSRFFSDNEDNAISPFCSGQNDHNNLKMIIDMIAHRAAKLVVVSIAGTILEGGVGVSSATPVAISAEGTTFYKAPQLKEYVMEYTKTFINDKLGRYCEYVHIEDATLLGTAVAGLSTI